MPAESPAGRTTLVTYLEMKERPNRPAAPAPRRGLRIQRARRPTLSFYRYLYGAVGQPWAWTARSVMTDRQLAKIVQDPAVEVHVLWQDGVPAGLAELDRRRPPEVELAYFGLIPEFIGQGLGRFLLDWAVDHAWRTQPRRLWVHTCDLDHPRALPLYQRAGFVAYQQRPEPAVPERPTPGAAEPLVHHP